MTAHPITMQKNEDGTYTVLYFDKVVGWIQPSKMRDGRQRVYRALTIHNDLKHFYGLAASKCWLISNYA